MMVIMAIVTTVVTPPLFYLLYAKGVIAQRNVSVDAAASRARDVENGKSQGSPVERDDAGTGIHLDSSHGTFAMFTTVMREVSVQEDVLPGDGTEAGTVDDGAPNDEPMQQTEPAQILPVVVIEPQPVQVV